MWAKPTGPGARTRGWVSGCLGRAGACLTGSLGNPLPAGPLAGVGSQGHGGFVPHTIAAALLDKGANKGAFGSGHTAQHPGRPQEASSPRPPTQAFPSSPAPYPAMAGPTGP